MRTDRCPAALRLPATNRWTGARGAVILIAALACHPARALTTCVHNAGELAIALANASTGGAFNAQDNAVLLASGSYSTALTGTFTFNTASGKSLLLEGGYDSGCTQQDPTPGASVLDGGGATLVLNVQTNGNVSVRHVTIQHGFRHGADGGGAQIYLNGAATNTAVFDANVVRDNVSDYAVGGLLIYGSGIAYVRSSLFFNNSAPSAAALFIDFGTGSSAYLTNATITGNSNSNAGTATTALGSGGGTISAYVSNTISYANTSSYDFFLYSNNSVQFTNDDYGAINGTPLPGSGNLNTDPKFVDAAGGDYRLAGNSPLLGAGLTNPAGGLSTTDLPGHAFPASGKADLGAFEETIFLDGFDG